MHLPLPHAGQALQIVRQRRTVRTGKVSSERVYAGLAGRPNIAEGLRHHGRDMARPLATLGLT